MAKGTKQRDGLSQMEMAKEFGVSRQTVNTWDHEGLAGAARVSDNPVRYDPGRAWHWRMENRPPNQTKHADMKELDRREKEAKVKVAELEAAEREGLVIPAEVVEEVITDAFARVRARIIAFKGGLAPRLVGLDTAREAKAVLDPAFDELISECQVAADDWGDEPADAA